LRGVFSKKDEGKKGKGGVYSKRWYIGMGGGHWRVLKKRRWERNGERRNDPEELKDQGLWSK